MKKPKKPKKVIRLLKSDCRQCPFPYLRDMDLCTLCATRAVDEDGKVFFHDKGIVEGA